MSQRGGVFGWHERALDLSRERKEKSSYGWNTDEDVIEPVWLRYRSDVTDEAAGNDNRNAGSDCLLLLTSHTLKSAKSLEAARWAFCGNDIH